MVGYLFTRGRRTILDIDMRYLVELDTVGGVIAVGVFDTLDSARAYLGGVRGRICPIWPPSVPVLALVECWSVERLAELLKGI